MLWGKVSKDGVTTMAVKDGWYIMCPKCYRIDDGSSWGEYERVIIVTTKKVIPTTPDSEVLEMEVEDIEEVDKEFLKTRHDCGFYTEVYWVDSFAVRIKDGKIVQAGVYYQVREDKLQKVAEYHGLKVELK